MELGVLPAKWLQSFLSDRNMYVQIGSVSSLMSNITLGVPQGSILGPWLFNIYINDLHKSLHICKCILYADDTTIFLSGRDYEEIRLKMNNDLKSVSKWFNCNTLSLNTKKSCFIIFHTRQRKLNNVNLSLSIGIEGTLYKVFGSDNG